MRFICLAITMSMIFAVDNAAAQGSKDREAALEVVDDFITGWREGDAERLGSAANLDHGHAIWLKSSDGTFSVTSVTFGEMIEGLTSHPEYGVPYRVLSINIVDGELAIANIAAQQGDRGTILDYFTLMKVNDRWEVVTLEWLWRPGMLVSAE